MTPAPHPDPDPAVPGAGGAASGSETAGEPVQGALLDLAAVRPEGPARVHVPGVTDPVARVALDVPLPHLDRLFDYLVTQDLDAVARPGVRVQVRFAGQEHSGFLVERGATSEHAGGLTPLRRVVGTLPVLNPDVLDLARTVARRQAGTLADVLRLAVPPRHASTETGELEKATPARTGEARVAAGGQFPVWSALTGGQAFLRRVGAGEGSRAVWTALPGTQEAGLIEAAEACLSSGRGVLIVVPSAREVRRVGEALAAALPDEPVVQLLADDGPARRYRTFLRVLLGRARVVVGTRSAAFAPLPNPGLLVCWDDGDDLLAEPRAPYPHARDVALARSELSGAALVLGGYSRSVAAQHLISRGVAHPVAAPRAAVRAAAPRVEAPTGEDLARDGAAGAARLPPAAFALARASLQRGPVLVQVARGGYLPVVACARCRHPARCLHCAGPLRLEAPRPGPSPAAQASCSRCGRPAGSWSCVACGSDHLRATAVGSGRTAEELGRAFPSIPVVVSGTSGAHGVVATLDATPRLVVATPGAEPVPADGYAAALLLDGGVLTSRPELGATAEALRRWFAAASLVRPASEGGRVMLLGSPAPAAAQALVRWDPAGAAERDHDERSALRLPPAVPTAALDGPAAAVADVVRRLENAAGERGLPVPEVLGPVPVEDGPGGAGTTASGGAWRRGPGSRGPVRGGAEQPVRAIVRPGAGPVAGPGGGGAAAWETTLPALLTEVTIARAVRREPGVVRVRMNPEDLW